MAAYSLLSKLVGSGQRADMCGSQAVRESPNCMTVEDQGAY
jgi:hypothetical protein